MADASNKLETPRKPKTGKGVGTGRLIMQEIYARIREDILSCTLRPGEKININELAERHSVSLSAVREALSRLYSEELVEQLPQKGYLVAAVDEDRFRQLVDARVEVECACLRRAIQLGDVTWETNIIATQYKMFRIDISLPDVPDRINPAWAAAHSEYHAALVEACQNQWLLRFRRMLFEHSERYRRLVVPTQTKDRDIRGEHERLTEATIDRDIALATKLMEEHLRATAQDTLAGYSSQELSD
ncbi:MAG: GntR family transcriptional regulator [Pseudomonadota bacterium]|nr:GntR family transcriptional regulator [Pseudomonadota bacterium]